MFGPEYPKIQTVFKRDERNVVVPWDWTLPELELLADVPWRWTEKVDGTNIRVHWNGSHVTIGGRTDNAQVPTFLLAELRDLMNEPPWHAAFPDSDDVTLYGEGYGPKIQSGGQYRDNPALILFDVRVGDWWLRPHDVADVASKFDLEVVPEMGGWTLREAIVRVQEGVVASRWPNARIEGLVGTPAVDLFTRKGERIIAKVKTKDFEDLARRGTNRQEPS